MSEISGNYNSTNPAYSTYANASNNASQVQVAEQNKNKQAKRASLDTSEGDMDIKDLMAKRPDLKAAFDNLAAIASDPSMDEPDVFTIQRLIKSLIDLGQALQQCATAYANRLAKITEKMNAYSKMLTQVPVVLKDDVNYGGDDKEKSDRRANLNQKYGNMLESVRANKGLEEDKAKKVQTMMQTMKDAGQSVNDFIGSFIDLIRGILQKIAR
jgi:uncharacterized protein YoxC